jgi:hypothetical protein
MKLQLMLGLTCGVCEHLRNDDNDVMVALFGTTSDPYAVCPSCRHEMTSDDMSVPEYRRRVRMFLFETRGIVLKTQ